MNTLPQDGLWPHFVPLWKDLRAIAPDLLLAGGYALFLKQQWLILRAQPSNGSAGIAPAFADDPTVIDISRWNDANPRVTKDFDFIVGLELIASTKDQHSLHETLVRHGFEVVPENARWQFQKQVAEGQSVLLDFQSPSPTEPRDDVRVEKRRVKPGRSLGTTGIHGRENRDANASEFNPFIFTHNSVEIAIPHPVAFAIMKLAAINDRKLASSDPEESAEIRIAEGRSALKHTEDLMRIVAMTTRSEMDRSEPILSMLRGTPSWAAASQAFAESFESSVGWNVTEAAKNWRDEDFEVMRQILTRWFGPVPPRS